MRLWSIHPGYLDARGLVALWREGLLAQKVLMGDTRGYTRHPQLLRFRDQVDPPGAIAAYLEEVYNAAAMRGYAFDRTRIGRSIPCQMTVTAGQIAHERQHLLQKLRIRDPQRGAQLSGLSELLPHPLFQIVPGPVEPWEVGVPRAAAAPPESLSPPAGSDAPPMSSHS